MDVDPGPRRRGDGRRQATGAPLNQLFTRLDASFRGATAASGGQRQSTTSLDGMYAGGSRAAAAVGIGVRADGGGVD